MQTGVQFLRWRDGEGRMHSGLSDGSGVLRLNRVLPGKVTGIDVLVQHCRESGVSLAEWVTNTLATRQERMIVPDHQRIIPVDLTELWAAGVTYDLSRDAREAETTSGRTIYAKVYEADRPEVFFKAVGPRLLGPGQPIGIRRGALWHVPEPELTAILDDRGAILGYTIGNDVTARDLEAVNPLYLPQAKMFDGSASIGPCLVLADSIDPLDLTILLEIRRGASVLFSGETSTQRLRRSPKELVQYLGSAYTVSPWTGFMTGTGIVPPDDVALTEGDEVAITVPGIGTLVNPVQWVPQYPG